MPFSHEPTPQSREWSFQWKTWLSRLRDKLVNTVLTGVSGTSGNLAKWDADGDLVDGPTPPTGDIVGTTDPQNLTNKTIGVSQITELSNLTAAEGAQLENIDSVTISNGQWGYLGGLTSAPLEDDDLTSNGGNVPRVTTSNTWVALQIFDSDDSTRIRVNLSDEPVPGGWARGWEVFKNGARDFGAGLLGSGSSVTRGYVGRGTSPWNNGLAILSDGTLQTTSGDDLLDSSDLASNGGDVVELSNANIFTARQRIDQSDGTAKDFFWLRETTDFADLVCYYNGSAFEFRSEGSGSGNLFFRTNPSGKVTFGATPNVGGTDVLIDSDLASNGGDIAEESNANVFTATQNSTTTNGICWIAKTSSDDNYDVLRSQDSNSNNIFRIRLTGLDGLGGGDVGFIAGDSYSFDAPVDISGNDVLDDSDIGSTVQAQDAQLQDIANNLTSSASELNKNDDSAAAISGYVSGMRTYLHEDGAASSTFSISANISSSVFESVGPTGSGATNIWTAMDDIPSGARIATISFLMKFDTTALDQDVSAEVHARATGSSASIGNLTRLLKLGVVYDDQQGNSFLQGVADVPLDSSQRVDITWVTSNVGAGVVVTMFLKGFKL